MRTDLRGGVTGLKPAAEPRQGGDPMKSLNPIAWWRERKLGRDSRDHLGNAAEEELYALLDEASKVSAG